MNKILINYYLTFHLYMFISPKILNLIDIVKVIEHKILDE
jgi:hypothetical protein